MRGRKKGTPNKVKAKATFGERTAKFTEREINEGFRSDLEKAIQEHLADHGVSAQSVAEVVAMCVVRAAAFK